MPLSPITNCLPCIEGRHEACRHRHGEVTLPSTTMLGCGAVASYCCCHPDPDCAECKPLVGVGLVDQNLLSLTSRHPYELTSRGPVVVKCGKADCRRCAP